MKSVGAEHWWNHIAGTLHDMRGLDMKARRRHRRRARRAKKASR